LAIRSVGIRSIITIAIRALETTIGIGTAIEIGGSTIVIREVITEGGEV